MSTSTVCTIAPGISPRETFIDWLRIIALCLLILFHVGMAYVGWNWHVKSAGATAELAAALVPWMWLTAPWRMTLLFVVSGLATSLMLQRRGDHPGWLRGRARRLLLPLVTGLVLIVPPQSYFEVRQFHGYTGSYVDFLRLYFSAESGFCAPQRGCLILPTWNHLWFLPYVFVYTAALALVQRGKPHWLDGATARLPNLLARSRLLWLPVAWLALTRITLRPIFGETHALVDDLFLHMQFAPAFAVGVLLARGAVPSPLWPRIEATRHVALVLACAGWALIVGTPQGPEWRALPWATMQWCAIVAALGYARRHLQRDSATRRYLSQAVFPVYLLHQTATVCAVAWLAPWRLGAPIEAALVLALTFGASIASYEVLRRLTERGSPTWLKGLRPGFGIGAGPATPGPLENVAAKRQLRPLAR